MCILLWSSDRLRFLPSALSKQPLLWQRFSCMFNVFTTEREVGSYFSDLRTSGFKKPEQYICLRYESFKWFYVCSPLVSWYWLMLHEGVARIIDLATAEPKTVSAFKLNRLVEGKGCHCFSHREFSPIMFAEVARVSRIDVIIVLKRSKASCN